MDKTVASLTKRIQTLAGIITKKTRSLREERMAIGKLLIELRSHFGIQNTHGGYRGSYRGAFVAHLEASGVNVGSAYSWIALAEGRKTNQHRTRNEISKFLTRLNKCETKVEKRGIAREVVAYLKKRFDF